jgi:G:T-mismatch repair DNA endonuclease (very short patch repair protein)
MTNLKKQWNKQEENLVKELYCEKGLSAESIAIILKRSKISVWSKIKRLKLKHSEEQIYKIKSQLRSGKNNPMYGKNAWCKGLTKETNEIIRTKSKLTSQTRKLLFSKNILNICGENNPMYGLISWNNGLTKETSPILKESGAKTSISKKNNWIALPEEEKNKIRKHCAIIGSRCKKKLTTIEIKVKSFLEQLGIDFIQNYYCGGFVFDFFIKSKNLVIECQGDYWHSNPRKYSDLNINEIQKNNKNRDERKKEYIQNNNINGLFIWEYDIRYNFSEVKTTIENKIKTL